ncbi:MAG: glycosyltransferase family 8 protein [Clostridiales bacterium]|nr:glycosyltransferase family 8 protein [Clostridiales bacterium]
MNILVTLNSGYINPLCTMLRSLSYSSSDESIALYVAHSSLEQDDFDKINAALSGLDAEVFPIRLSSSLFNTASTQKRISKETYYRLFSPLFLPECVDRILYIDPDTVVINSLKSFYYTPFGENLIIAAKHFDGAVDLWNRKRLCLKSSPKYINAGVMLMNIRALREVFTPDRVYSVLDKKVPVLFLDDQDVLNVLYDGRIKIVTEYKINLDERSFARLLKHCSLEESLEFVRSNTLIIHYNGKNKPWNADYKGYLQNFYLFFEQYSPLPFVRCYNAEA